VFGLALSFHEVFRDFFLALWILHVFQGPVLIYLEQSLMNRNRNGKPEIFTVNDSCRGGGYSYLFTLGKFPFRTFPTILGQLQILVSCDGKSKKASSQVVREDTLVMMDVERRLISTKWGFDC